MLISHQAALLCPVSEMKVWRKRFRKYIEAWYALNDKIHIFIYLVLFSSGTLQKAFGNVDTSQKVCIECTPSLLVREKSVIYLMRHA